jgi:ATP-dependent exoDNAse (exonuclease V) beta subunit
MLVTFDSPPKKKKYLRNVSTARFRVYKSSAGSGKTHNLVREYLEICLNTENPSATRGILALTFTNKAAGEMKDRVLKALNVLHFTPDKSPYLEGLSNFTGLSPQALSERAGNCLTYILHNYSDFSVGTIDRFIYRLIRTFSRDLQLDTEIEVEMDVDRLLERTISLVLSRAGEDEQLTHILKEFSFYKIAEDKPFKIEADMLQIAKMVRSESNREPAQQLAESSPAQLVELAGQFKQRRRQLIDEVSARARVVFKLLEDSGGGVSDFAHGKTGLYGYLRKLTFKDSLTSSVFPEVNKNMLKALDTESYYSKSAPGNVQQYLDNHAAAITEGIRQLLMYQAEHQQEFAQISITLPFIYSLALIREIENSLREMSDHENLVPISEFNALISSIIRNEPAPFIYERLGDRYTHFMLDEFQDTSVMQWQNMLPLVDNALSQGGSAMLFGDTKQAIYRWRNGEARQFNALPDVFPNNGSRALAEHQAVLHQHFAARKLNTNFRSHKVVVDFNNQIFKALTEHVHPLLLSLGYDDVSQIPHHQNDQGYVSLRFLTKEEGKEDIAQNLMEIINDCRSRGARWRDITILTRTRRDGVIASSALMQHHIPVISDECLMLKEGEPCVVVMALLNWVAGNDSGPAGVAVLEYLVHTGYPLNIQNYIQSSGDASKRFYKSTFRMEAMLQDAGKPHEPEAYRGFTLTATINNIARHMGIAANNPYLMTILDHAHALQRKTGSDYAAFLEWWNERGRDLPVKGTDSPDAVSVMTIHKSKGLEFPIVILPFLNWSTDSGDGYAWVEVPDRTTGENRMLLAAMNGRLEDAGFGHLKAEEDQLALADSINLLYVAFTRAEKELYGLVPEKSGKNVGTDLATALKAAGLMVEGQSQVHYGQPDRYPEMPEAPAHQQLPDSTAQAANPFQLLSPAQSSNRRVGEYIHQVFARSRERDDISSALQHLRKKNLLAEKEWQMVREQTEKVMHSDIVMQALFPDWAERIVCEGEISDPLGNVIRPDRIYLAPGKRVVADVKTGEKRSNEHLEQVQKYVSVLRVLGDENVEGILIYTDLLEIVEVGDV